MYYLIYIIYLVASTAFSTGFVFWYWPYYAPKGDVDGDGESKEDGDQPIWSNDNDFGGFSKRDLYSKKGKFGTFKAEILEYKDGKNGDITMDIYTNTILVKLKQYIHTNRVKKMQAKDTNGGMHDYFRVLKAVY